MTILLSRQSGCMSWQGLVVFFPSFSYAEQALGHWERSGALAAFCQHKQVFRSVCVTSTWQPRIESAKLQPNTWS